MNWMTNSKRVPSIDARRRGCASFVFTTQTTVRIDLLTSMSGVTFDEAWPARVEVERDG